MGREVNLLKGLPAAKRNISSRSSAKTEEIISKSREYGFDYFDGDRSFGYGGYRYDGRWRPVAKDIVSHFNLLPGDKVLDIGCAKGFLVKDLIDLGIDAYGVDVSKYALLNCEPEVVGRLHLGSADNLPFPSGSFSAVISINTIHNLEVNGVRDALKEVERLAPGRGFIQVDSFYTEEQKAAFEEWVLTARYYDYPEKWKLIFNDAGYTGDYYWTIIN
jgi:cyclopropane fatty-acyl-phospholipid synthase-like methyltransferase